MEFADDPARLFLSRMGRAVAYFMQQPCLPCPRRAQRPDRVVRQRPLQRLGLVPWRAHPDIPLFI
jgi:hypothetical protein